MLSRIFMTIMLVLSCAVSAFAADPYTVTGVHVDATAKNALEAQTLAISQGQAEAANILIERMSLASERTEKGFRGVSVSDGVKMIRAMEIPNEKRSSNRYLGDITVAFNPNAVSQYMRLHGLTLVATQSRKRLVIPVLEGSALWSGNEWENAWQQGVFDNALTPMAAITPHDGLGRILGAGSIRNISLANLRALGQLFGVEQVLIATTSGGYAGYTVSLQDIALDTGKGRRLAKVTGVNAVEAANAVVAALENDWKANAVSTKSSASVTMSVSVLYRSQTEWLQLQDAINSSAQIRSASLDAISKRGAVMSLSYGGDVDKLRNELAYKGVRLVEDEKLGMVLSRTGAF